MTSESFAAAAVPRIVRLDSNLIGVAFELMKLLPARYMLDRATERGELRPGATLLGVEAGSFGLALAMQAVVQGYRCILTANPGLDHSLRRRLRFLGADVERGRNRRAPAVRPRRAASAAHCPCSFRPDLHGSDDNRNAYGPVAELLIEHGGLIDCLVGPVGSGGAVCGTAGYLRSVLPHLYTVGVDTPGSVLFGRPAGRRKLAGVGGSTVPRSLDHRAFDEVHWVPPAAAYRATRSLLGRHALFQGPSSGASYLVARWWAKEHPEALVACLLPDGGTSYLDTVYSDAWLRRQRSWIDRLPARPRPVSSPGEAGLAWSRFPWQRRSLEEVLAAVPPPAPLRSVPR
jgi:cysteine synthase